MIKYIEIVCKECNKAYVYIEKFPIDFDQFNWRMGGFFPCPYCDIFNYKRFGFQVGKGFIIDNLYKI